MTRSLSAGSTLLLLVALVGTTLALWRPFFQQSTLVLLLILCNDKHLLGTRTNTRLRNAAAMIAIATVLSLSTLLTITTVLKHLGLGKAVIITAALWAGAGTALALTTRFGPAGALTRTR